MTSANTTDGPSTGRFTPRALEPQTLPPRPLIPVIMCGGSGRRLWPLSRTLFPKQLLSVGDGLSLFQSALARAAATGAADILVVTHRGLAAPLRDQVAVMDCAATIHFLLEPSARNTAAAIAYAALYARTEIAESTLWVLASDHVVANDAALQQAVVLAANAAEQAARLVTFGITPTRPDTAYGYIHVGEQLSDELDPVRTVARFVEKPSRDVAQQMLSSGDYVWNSGMFVLPADKYLAELMTAEPALHGAVCGAYESRTIDGVTCTIPDELYAAIPSMAVDTAVMEQSPAVAVVPCDDLGWSDVGSWRSWWEASPRTAEGNAISGDVVVAAAAGNLIIAGSRLVACVGVDNLAILESGDAVLVAGIDADGADIRAAVASLGDRVELHQPASSVTPWGDVRVLARGLGHTVVHITVKPGNTGSWSPPTGRTVSWTAVTPIVIDGASLNPGEGAATAAGAAVALANPGAGPAHVAPAHVAPAHAAPAHAEPAVAVAVLLGD